MAPLGASQAHLGIFGPVRGLPGGGRGLHFLLRPMKSPGGSPGLRGPVFPVSETAPAAAGSWSPGLRSRSRKVRMTPQDFAQSLGKGCVFLGAKLLLIAARAAPGRQVAPASVPKSPVSALPFRSGIGPSHLLPAREHSHPGRIPAPAPAVRLWLEDRALVTHRPQGAREAPREAPCVLLYAFAPLAPERGDRSQCAVVTKPVSALRPFGWVLKFSASPRKALPIPFPRRQTEA